ncbi:MAG TPA: hypothetical protein VMV92_30345 [Streptosporangiaceae bacterium]|nr:hypothetical protein [Streptosporangiaceae bacterium]
MSAVTAAAADPASADAKRHEVLRLLRDAQRAATAEPERSAAGCSPVS